MKFLGITLAMGLETTRGGVKAFWDDDEDLTGTIYQNKNYKTRFGMSRHRFQEIRTCLAMGGDPANVVICNMSIIIIYYNRIMIRGFLFDPSLTHLI